MSNLEIAKKVIIENFNRAKFGIFNTRNVVGDETAIIYKKGKLAIEIAMDWHYFEVFGLTKEEFEELKEFYKSIGGRV